MKNKGFSLVELIVVIAIMAILVGVAVPVYTSYIEKTQKNKDIQMVDEIKHAIEIAAVGESWYQTMSNGGMAMIVITEGGTTVQGPSTQGSGDLSALVSAAMTKTFGSLESLKLSYDGWKGTLTSTNLADVVGSTYYNNVPTLMGDVQNLTNALDDFVMHNKGDLFSAANGYSDFVEKLTGKDIEDCTSQEIANAATLYVADQMVGLSSVTDAEAFNEEAFISVWSQPQTPVFTSQDVVAEIGYMPAVAADYARLEAMVTKIANDSKCTEILPLFRELSASLGLDSNGNAATASSVVTGNLEKLYQKISEHLSPTTAEGQTAKTCSCSATSVQNYFEGGSAAQDAKAYLALLGQVKASESKISGDLGNSSLYTSKELTSYVNDYISVADVLNEIPNADGAVVVVVKLDAAGNISLTAYPMDYQD